MKKYGYLSAICISVSLLGSMMLTTEVFASRDEGVTISENSKKVPSIMIPNKSKTRITNLTNPGKELRVGDVIEFESSFKLDYNLEGISDDDFTHSEHEFDFGSQAKGGMVFVPGSLEARTEGGIQIGSDWEKYKLLSDDHVTMTETGIKIKNTGDIYGSQTRHYRYRIELLKPVENLVVNITDKITRDKELYPDFYEDSVTVTEDLTIEKFKSLLKPNTLKNKFKNLSSPGEEIKVGDIFEYENKFNFSGIRETEEGFTFSNHDFNWGDKGVGVAEYVPNTFETRVTGGVMVGDSWKKYMPVSDSHIKLKPEGLVVRGVNNDYHPTILWSGQNRHYRFQMKALKPIKNLSVTATDTIERDGESFIGHLKDSVSVTDNLTIGTKTTWEESKTYNKGDKVIYESQEYITKWWVKGENPINSDAWELVNGNDVVKWSPLKAYTSGSQVSHEGSNYQARWWTKGDIPSSESLVWKKL